MNQYFNELIEKLKINNPVLVDYQIKNLATKLNMIEGFRDDNLNPSSYDVTVSDSAKILNSHGVFIDITLDKDYFYLHPNEKMLLSSEEIFNLPNWIAAQFRLKSSRGREFYEHLEAGWCDPGWSGSKLTMEIINLNNVPLPIYKGLKIGQMIFFKLNQVPKKSYKVTGRYNGDRVVKESKG